MTDKLEQFRQGWHTLHDEGGGYFDLGIFKPYDMVELLMRKRSARENAFVCALAGVIVQWEGGLRPPCFCCGTVVDDLPHAIAVMLPDASKPSIAMNGILCRACGNGTYQEAKERVLRFLRDQMMTDLIVLQHAAGSA